MGRHRQILGQLVKYPSPGEVKTRLGREIGYGKAACLYRLLAERVLSSTAPAGDCYERVVFYSPEGMRREFEDWLPGEHLLQQKGKDLGDIMGNAVRDLLNRGAERAVITGVDIPGLTRDIIRMAFHELDGRDVAIGPAADGGYYLIGMKSFYPELFREMPWGSEDVFRETISAIVAMDLCYGAVPSLRDVDRLKDLQDPDTGLLW